MPDAADAVARQMVAFGAGFGGYYIALVDPDGRALLVDNSCESAEHAELCAIVLAERMAETLRAHLNE
jgi:hypothetical protein